MSETIYFYTDQKSQIKLNLLIEFIFKHILSIFNNIIKIIVQN